MKKFGGQRSGCTSIKLLPYIKQHTKKLNNIFAYLPLQDGVGALDLLLGGVEQHRLSLQAGAVLVDEEQLDVVQHQLAVGEVQKHTIIYAISHCHSSTYLQLCSQLVTWLHHGSSAVSFNLWCLMSQDNCNCISMKKLTISSDPYS